MRRSSKLLGVPRPTDCLLDAIRGKTNTEILKSPCSRDKTFAMASEEASWGGEEYSVADGDDTPRSDQQVDGFAQDSNVAGDPTGDAEVEAEEEEEEGSDDGADYDPESVTFNAPQLPEKSASATPSQRPQAKPKMSGGFVMDASDDEDDEDDDESPAPTGAPEPAQNEAEADAVPQPQAATTHQPEVPFSMPGLDPVMLLEARIKEDPRGDMDAWLNLIADHKRRNRFDELRTVYNRFLEVFPQAVSCLTLPSIIVTNP